MALFRVLAAVLYLCVRCLPCLSADADFSYNGFQRAAANLSLDGSASVLDDKSHLTGHAFLDSPVRMHRAGDGVVVSFSTAFVFEIRAGIGAAFWLRQRAAVAETLEEWELDHPHRFAYKELHRATKGFSDSELLGAGGFGKVYRGVLKPSGDVVVVKRISNNGKQGMREFVAEVASLGRLRHRNLEGVAAGLLYLHEEWEQAVVHRDVKASNVLLGADDGNARLGDFGLARLHDHGGDPATTRVVGTLGYMSPEVFEMGRATAATDVFAFGVLLLEAASGRRPVDPATGASLLRWVRELGVTGKLLRAVDERLEGCYDEEEATRVLWLGLACSQTRPEARPTMRQVCQYLVDGKFHMQEIVFTDADSLDFGSLASLAWSSCATMATGSLQLQDGR
ncbi:hypothetical protein PR202_ga07678 [Eleusine coracana subsp. coracana]|uniref:non-specific serine/threonine protein kinase n=1 Tax=Eleusine coracana subsp. coracana TaxID=191504 RepID=A0AAV5BZ43_ELECO|nr:hypothetical protein PR202_ga07678 [Eleusine coracana subsp. coracana]